MFDEIDFFNRLLAYSTSNEVILGTVLLQAGNSQFEKYSIKIHCSYKDIWYV